MKVTAAKNEQVANMIFASVYPHYLNRLLKNGRTEEELEQVIEWLTVYNSIQLATLIQNKVSFRTFFQEANMHPNAPLIKGVICGYRIEDIDDEFGIYRQCRYLDKLVDELAKGRKMEKIMRKKKK